LNSAGQRYLAGAKPDEVDHHETHTPSTNSIDFDYYWVVAFNRLAELGATMDMYVNGGGMKKAMGILSKVSSCDTATVFDALSVRYDDER